MSVPLLVAAVAVAALIVLLAVPAALAASPVSTALPGISGSAVQGSTLSASAGSWSNSPTSYGYQWRRCTAITYSGAVVADSPVGFWRLEQSSTASAAVDSSGNGNDGSYAGGVTLSQTGAVTDESDSAAAFDASTGYVTVPNSGSLNSPTSAITLEAWVKPSASVNEPIILKSYTSHTDPYYQYGLFQYYDQVRLDLTLGGTRQSFLSSSGAITVGSWNYLVATYDGSTVHFYVNGTAVGSASASGSISTYATPLDLATYENLRTYGSSYFYGGAIDEAAVYDTALSSGQVAAHYAAATTAAAASCSNISGATSSSYTLTGTDANHLIEVTVTATNADGSTAATSDPTGLVVPTYPLNTSPPAISGDMVWHGTISSSTGSWSNTPTSYSYQWQRCNSTGGSCSNISSATSSSYTLTDSDEGHRLRVNVTAANANGSSDATSDRSDFLPSRTSSTGYRDLVLTENPVGYWGLGESSGSTAADAGPHGYDLTYQQATPNELNQGVPQGPLRGADSGAISIFDNTGIDGGGTGAASDASGGSTPVGFIGTAPFTANVWVRWDGARVWRGSGMRAGIIGSGWFDGYGAGWGVYVTGNTDGSLDGVLTFRRGSYGNVDSVNASQPLFPGEWAMVTASYDGTTMRLYLDGQLVGSKASSKSVSGGDGLLIGMLNFNTSLSGYYAYFNGALDEASVYAQALSDVQILQQYQEAAPPQQTVGESLGPQPGSLAANQSGSKGEPVNTATGSFYSSAVDVALPGVGVPFTFTRSYNSDDPASGTLGAGWTDNLAWALTIDDTGSVIARSGTGQQLNYSLQGDGSFVADSGGRATLTAVSGGYELVTTDQTHYLFNSTGQLTGETDRNGHGLTFAYDGSGHLQSVTDQVGREIDFTTTSGHLTEIDLPDGRSVSYGYTSGKLTSFTDLSGHTVTYTYDGNGLLASITDQNGNTAISNVYDSATGRVTEQTDGRGHHSYFDWDPATQTSTYTDARGKVWTDVYTNNVLVSQTNPLSKTTTYSYDTDLDQIAGTSPAGKTTTMSYDANGNLLTRTASSPLGYTQTWTYDAFNDVATYTNGRGKTTTYGYDGAGNLTSVTGPDPDGAGGASAPETDYGLDATTKQVTSVADPRGKETDFGYDADGNLTSITTPEGEETTMGYDAGGRMTSKVEARGNVTGCSCASNYTWTYSYDDANHRLSQTDPLSHETDWTYYPGGQLETVTDANSHTTTYSYDDDNNLSTVTDPDSKVTTYSYDYNNNLLSKEDANSHTTSYSYDDANHLASKELPGGQTWTYSYNDDGDLATMVDANGNATGTAGDGTTTYGYDALDRLTSVDYSGSDTPDVTYTYDGDGNRTQMTDGAGTVTYSYDGLDRLTGVTRSGHSFAYGYDDNSNRTSETYPDSTVVAYSYTDDEQLHTVASNSQTTSYGYDPAGNLASTAYPSGNGYTETDSYDHAGRLTNVDNHAGATVLSEFDYTLDPVGNPLEVDQTGAISSTTTYGYDSLDRLTLACLQASCPLSTDPKVSWTYDYVGNRLTQTSGGSTVTSTYNSDDRLIARGATSYSYDANGNQTAAGANTFSYDLANRLLTADVSATTTTYSYDGDGNRLQASTGSSPSDKTNFTWDPAADQPQLDAETDGSGNPVRDYLYGNKLISMTTAALATYYYHYDALGSVANLTNSSGATKWTYSYDAWGNPTATPTSGAPDNPVQYTTGYTDPTGLTHLGAREYDPATGRFLQADPANLATGSTYSYTDDRPTTVVDRTGLGASVLGYAVPVAVPFVPDILAQAGAASAGLSYGALFGVGFWVATKVSAGSYSPQHTTELPMATKATPPAPSAFPNFDDPSTPPGDGWEWRGNGAPGSKEGSWYNPGSGESLHPDLDHGEPIGPHYDWKSPSAPNKKGYRVYPDGEVVPK